MVEGKGMGRAAGESESSNSPKRWGLEQGGASGSDVMRRGSNGSAVETREEAGEAHGRQPPPAAQLPA